MDCRTPSSCSFSPSIRSSIGTGAGLVRALPTPNLAACFSEYSFREGKGNCTSPGSSSRRIVGMLGIAQTLFSLPRQPQGQSLWSGLGAGGPATQGIALRYSYTARRSWSVRFLRPGQGIVWRRSARNGAGMQLALTIPDGQAGWRLSMSTPVLMI
jgi:hypothetical protein